MAARVTASVSRLCAPEGCGVGSAAVQLHDQQVLTFGHEQLTALHTPGHTAGSMSYLWRSHVFTGDTLLINGCGRTDFQSGSAQALYKSLTEVLFNLPGSTSVWPGHDYQGKSHSSIDIEKASNARVANKTLAEFMSTMNNLNLPTPMRLHEAVAETRRLKPGHQLLSAQPLPQRRQDKAEQELGLAESDLGLRRMHVDVDRVGRHVEKQHRDRVSARHQQAAIRLLNRVR